jgi:hypothetical protein
MPHSDMHKTIRELTFRCGRKQVLLRVLIPRRIWKEVALIRVWLEDTNENRTCER